MLKSIGIIGYGFVGKACHKAFEHNTEAVIIDPLHSETTWEIFAANPPSVTFIALPAPTLADGTVDAGIIYTVFQQLLDIKYAGLVVLKSTLPPNIVRDLSDKFATPNPYIKTNTLRYIYSPEFLRERHWEEDVIRSSHLVMAGSFRDCKELELIYENHSHVKHLKFHICEYEEASLMKYAINSFLASKVVFMNQLHSLYTDMYNEPPSPIQWSNFVQLLEYDTRFGNSHADVPGPDQRYGYGGSCFPKDVKALLGYDTNARLTVLREVELANTKIRLTDNK